MSKFIKLIQACKEYNVPSSFVTKMYNIVSKKNDGINVIDDYSNFVGQLNSGPTYQEYITTINSLFPALEITPSSIYIKFEDPEVLRVLLSIGYGDGYGITEEDAAIQSFSTDRNNGTWNNNEYIVKFNEFKYFIAQSNMTALFKNCISLQEVTMPRTSMGWWATYPEDGPFNGCISLTKVNWNNCVVTCTGSFENDCRGLYNGCTSLDWYDGIIPIGCRTLGNGMFSGSGVTKIIMPEGMTFMGGVASTTRLEYIELPRTLEKINFDYWGNQSAKHINIVLKCDTPPELYRPNWGYHGKGSSIYIKDELYDSFLTGVGWEDCTWIQKKRLSELPEVYWDMGTLMDDPEFSTYFTS